MRSGAPFHWSCCNADCGGPKNYRFSVTRGTIFQDTKISLRLWFKVGYLMLTALVGTVFENTNYPLPIWFEVIYLICQSKKGMSALQIQWMLKENGRPTAYKTAFYICHRVRAMLRDDGFPKLMGQVEVDETYIGGKQKNKHANKREHLGRGAFGSGKVGVIGAISRKGNVVCQMIENTDAKTLNGFVRKVVSDKVDLVATDEHLGYSSLNKIGFPHESVSIKQLTDGR